MSPRTNGERHEQLMYINFWLEWNINCLFIVYDFTETFNVISDMLEIPHSCIDAKEIGRQYLGITQSLKIGTNEIELPKQRYIC